MRTLLAVLAVALTIAEPGRLGAQTDTVARSVRVSVAGERRGVRIDNRSSERVCFAAFERGLSEVMDWVPGIGGTCAGVPPRGRIVIPWDSVSGFVARSREAHVFTWRLAPDARGRLHAVGISATLVRRPR
jgi:hypothetical protein